jgi:lia operon protein LiaG
MKKIRMIQIIQLLILVVIAIGLIAFLGRIAKGKAAMGKEWGIGFALNVDWGNKNDRQLKLLKEETINVEGIQKIELDFRSTDIEVLSTNEKVIRIAESSNRALEERQLFQFDNEDGILKVRGGKGYDNNLMFGFFMHLHKIQIYIPQGYNKDLVLTTSSGDIIFLSDSIAENILINQSSGDLRVEKSIQTNTFKSFLSSGDMYIAHITCKEYDLKASSGDIDIDYLKGSGDMQAKSGDITIKELKDGEYDIQSSSGDVRLLNVEDCFGEINISSGDLEADYTGITGETKLISSSGDITLNLAKNISFEMEAVCMSGDIEGNLPIVYKDKREKSATATVGNGPYAKLLLKASSGDINVNQN